MAKDIIELDWILPESEKDDLVQALELSGATVEDSGGTYRPVGDETADYPAAGFEPLTIITATAAAIFVVERLMKVWRDRKVQGGVVVDARGDRLRVRRVPTMASGRLVVVTKDSANVVEPRDESAGQALLNQVLSAYGSSKS